MNSKYSGRQKTLKIAADSVAIFIYVYVNELFHNLNIQLIKNVVIRIIEKYNMAAESGLTIMEEILHQQVLIVDLITVYLK